MRFSLTTLLLAAFWIAALMLVWMGREPWVVHSVQPQCPPFNADSPAYSPDGTRQADNFMGNIQIARRDAAFDEEPFVRFYFPCHRMAFLPGGSKRQDIAFVDDNQIVLALYRDEPADEPREKRPVEYQLLRRRFPEWWWGHFYRPEVWLALALAGVLLWRGARAWRTKTSTEAMPV